MKHVVVVEPDQLEGLPPKLHTRTVLEIRGVLIGPDNHVTNRALWATSVLMPLLVIGMNGGLVLRCYTDSLTSAARRQQRADLRLNGFNPELGRSKHPQTPDLVSVHRSTYSSKAQSHTELNADVTTTEVNEKPLPVPA